MNGLTGDAVVSVDGKKVTPKRPWNVSYSSVAKLLSSHRHHTAGRQVGDMVMRSSIKPGFHG